MNNVELVAGWWERQTADRRRLERNLDGRPAEDALRALLANVIAAREEQRRQLAHELDNETAQTLTSVLLDLQTLEAASELAKVCTGVDVLRASVSGLLRVVQRLAAGLHPSLLDDFGLDKALEQLALTSSRRGEFSVDLRLRSAPSLRLAEPIEIGLYRITEEALRQARTHALAKFVSVLVDRSDAKVRLVIEDDGVGFEVAAPPLERQLALLEMRERARALGGAMKVHSSVGRGTTVCIRVPLSMPRPLFARRPS